MSANYYGESEFNEKVIFHSDVNFSGNVTGNLTGNVSGNLTGDVSGNITGDINSSGISTFQSIKIVGLQDSLSGYGGTGAFLRSDGQNNVFWDNTPFGVVLPYGPQGSVGVGTTTQNYYIGSVVRGYTMGGYQNSVAYKNIYRTYHSTDTTTDLGAIMNFFAAYTDATSSGRYAYQFDGHTASAYDTAGKDINKFDMLTDSIVALTGMGTIQMNATKGTNTNVVRYKFLRAYVFGNTDPEKFQFSTETATVASTSWTDRNSLQWRQRAYGDDVAYFKTTGTGYQLTFASETWESWTPGGAFGNGVWGCISTYAGYIYWKNSATNWQKYNVINTSSVILNVTTPSQQEENYHTGESKGYMVGMYNGTGTSWQSTGGILDYISDTFKNVSTVDAPAINSSAGCPEFGRFGYE